MNRSNGLYNIITLVFTMLTVVVCLLVVLLFTKTIQPPVAFSPATPIQATVAVFPSTTPSITPSLTPLPTNTDEPTSTKIPTKTFTPSKTPSDTPTITPTFTITFTPSNTATNSKTPTNTKTSVPPSATTDPSLPTKTPPGFPFKVGDGNPAYTANLNTAVGCNFQGVAGQVYDLNNQPLLNLTISVTSPSGFNQSSTSGASTQFYGPAGWLVQTASSAGGGSFVVELRTDKGVPLSPKINVTFSGACDQNLALINFFQKRPY